MRAPGVQVGFEQRGAGAVALHQAKSVRGALAPPRPHARCARRPRVYRCAAARRCILCPAPSGPPPAPGSSFAPRPRAAAHAARAAPGAACAISRQPLVSRSSRCASSSVSSRTRGAQRLDDAEGQAAAAVHRNARGLVEHDQPLVLVHDRALDALDQRGGHRRRRRLRGSASAPGAPAPYRRPQALFGAGPPAVDPHLAAADQAEDAAARHSGQQPESTLSSRWPCSWASICTCRTADLRDAWRCAVGRSRVTLTWLYL